MITLHIGFLSPRLLPLLCAKTHTQLFCQLTQSQVVTKQLCMLRSVTSDLFSYSITFPLSLLPIHEVIICCSRTDLYLHSYSTHTHMHKTGSKNYDVAVIGAGISGLWTAKQLQDIGLSVVVVEASSRVGGRVYTKQMPNGTVVELGGTYFNSSFVRLKQLISNYDLAVTSKQSDSPKASMHRPFHSIFFDALSGQRIKFGGDQRAFSFRCVFASLDFNHFLRQLDLMAAKVPLECPWEAENAQALDSRTVAQFIDEQLSNQQAKRTARFFINLNVCAQPEEVSLLWFLWLVKQCGSARSMIGAMRTGSEHKLAMGMQQLCDRLANELNEDALKLNNGVVGCDYTANCVVLRMRDFSLIKTQKVVFAIPLAVLAKIHFSPPLTPLMNQTPYKQPMGACIRFVVHYDRPFWNELNFSGHLMINSDQCSLFTYDDTRNASFGLTGFLVADCARARADMQSHERQEWIVNQLAIALQDDRFRTPLSYEEHNWMQDQYIGGGFNSYAGPGYLTIYKPALKSNDTIFLAGCDLSPKMINSLEGALLSAEEAVHQVAKAFNKQTKLMEYPIDSSTLPEEQTFWQKWAPSSYGLMKMGAVTIVVSTVAMRLISTNK